MFHETFTDHDTIHDMDKGIDMDMTAVANIISKMNDTIADAETEEKTTMEALESIRIRIQELDRIREDMVRKFVSENTPQILFDPECARTLYNYVCGREDINNSIDSILNQQALGNTAFARFAGSYVAIGDNSLPLLFVSIPSLDEETDYHKFRSELLGSIEPIFLAQDRIAVDSGTSENTLTRPHLYISGVGHEYDLSVHDHDEARDGDVHAYDVSLDGVVMGIFENIVDAFLHIHDQSSEQGGTPPDVPLPLPLPLT